MSPAAGAIFSRVLELLDEADEIGGVESTPDYLELMAAISAHAAKRAKTAAAENEALPETIASAVRENRHGFGAPGPMPPRRS